MKTKLISPLVLIVFGMVILITCNKKDTVLTPVANAGPDQVITLPTDSVLLDGSASAPNGKIREWLWTKVSGPATFNITSSSLAKPRVKNLLPGIYKFELKVTSNDGLTDIDDMTITVITHSNQLPLANAGADTTLKVLMCESKGSATLDGSLSIDPLYNITAYLWSQISGPTVAILTSPTSAKPKAENLSIGQYVFQLQIWNVKGVSSKDTVKVNVTAETAVFDLDLTINGSFNFVNNYEDCYYGPPCYIYDYTTIQAKFYFPQLGPFNCWADEYADSSSTSEGHTTYMTLYADNNTGNVPRVAGKSSINFKKIIQKGGGAFSGTLQIDYGSGEKCDPNIYKSLDPLTITGSLDTTAHTISFAIKGKTYF